MVESAATSAWQLLIVAIISSGVAVALLESFREWLFKRREEFVEQSKQKIEIISKATPYYNQLAMNSWNFGHDIIETIDLDYQLLFYYLCNMLHYKYEINKKFGDLQFDSLCAEKIINGFWGDIICSITKLFGNIDTSKLRCLVENDIPYHIFYENLSKDENKVLYDKFVKWIRVARDEEIDEKCMWYSQLIMLELNHIYKSWYGQEPPLILRTKLQKYLAKKERKYYQRIKSFHLKTLLQKNPSTHSQSK